jgi:hypothetical protein
MFPFSQTRSSQLEALHYIRVAAIRQNTLLCNREKLIAKSMQLQQSKNH